MPFSYKVENNLSSWPWNPIRERTVSVEESPWLSLWGRREPFRGEGGDLELWEQTLRLGREAVGERV